MRSGSSARISRRTRRRTSTSAAAPGRIGGADYTLVDYNRGGTPLVEIVTAPDIHSAEEAKRFLQLLRQTIVELGISDAEMEKGTLRVDANVSVRPAGSDELRTRCEIKNMNSFTHIARGIEAEIARQIEVWESGGEVEQHTYDFDVATGDADRRGARRRRRTTTATSRSPTSSRSSRPRSSSSGCGRSCPSCPRARIRRIGRALDHERALVLVTGGLDRLWEATVAAGADAGRGRERRSRTSSSARASTRPRSMPAELAKLVEARDRIPRKAFDEAIAQSASPASRPSRISRRRPSRTRPRSSRSSTRSSPRTRARSRRTAAGRRAARLLRRPGDEGDAGPGRRARRERARAREAEPGDGQHANAAR